MSWHAGDDTGNIRQESPGDNNEGTNNGENDDFTKDGFKPHAGGFTGGKNVKEKPERADNGVENDVGITGNKHEENFENTD